MKGIGHNALRVFETMGILDAVSNAAQGPRMPLFSFVLGEEPHRLIYQVCALVATVGVNLLSGLDLQYPDTVEKDQGLGLHRYVVNLELMP